MPVNMPTKMKIFW